MMMSRRNSVRFTTVSSNPDSASDTTTFRPQMSRRSSNRYGEEPPSSVGDDVHPSRSMTAQVSRRRSLVEDERGMSAREAIAAQEAAEAAAAQEKQEEEDDDNEEEDEEFSEVEEEDDEAEEEEGMAGGMSLMDLLEETDRQMGVEGAKYVVGEEENEENATYYEDDEDDTTGTCISSSSTSTRMENTCCVCSVRHKAGAPFNYCGHTFCRLCSKELMVQRGSCPLCNSFILEILDIF